MKTIGLRHGPYRAVFLTSVMFFVTGTCCFVFECVQDDCYLFKLCLQGCLKRIIGWRHWSRIYHSLSVSISNQLCKVVNDFFLLSAFFHPCVHCLVLLRRMSLQSLIFAFETFTKACKHWPNIIYASDTRTCCQSACWLYINQWKWLH